MIFFLFFFSSRRRHTRWNCDWSSDVCSSDLGGAARTRSPRRRHVPRSRPRQDRAEDSGEGERGHHGQDRPARDRKSTRLNSSHSSISYAVFCLKKKKKQKKKT